MTTHFVALIGISRRKGVTHHIADVVGNELDFSDSQLVQDCGEVTSLRGLFVTAFRMGRQAHAAQQMVR
jgi:hypothetical protein